MMIKAVVFDLWQTLVPATIDFTHLSSLVRNSGLTLPEFIQRYEEAVQLKKYASFAELRKDFFKAFNQIDNAILEAELYEVYTNRIDKIRFYPEVERVLKKLRTAGYKVALLSNTESLIEAPLEKNVKLRSHFDVVGVSYEIGAIKPDPKAFLFVLKKLGVTPSEALMVGDSLRSDMMGAKSLGMHYCLINRLGKVIDTAKVKPEFEIKSLDEVSKVLGVLNGEK